MELIVAQASKLKAQVRLGRAISAFYESLDTENKAVFNSYRDAAHAEAPGLGDIRLIVAEIDRKARKPCGDRFKRVLEALQQFLAVGDVLIGSTQNVLAAGVWSVARLTVMVMTGYSTYRDAVSEVFLEVGRSAPRHAELASIYPGAERLRSAMMEYFIVVVELCHSVFQASPLDRFKTSLKATFTDPGLQKIKGSFARLSREINEEVVVLQSRRLEENNGSDGVRSIVRTISETDRRRKRARARAKWLDACTDYDYEKQHNLVRRGGNTGYFLDDPSYQDWKAGNGPSVLFCEGKLGSGKSVLMANMVDDIIFEKLRNFDIVAYFFVSDDTTGNRARTVLGSLARQILESLPDSQWTDLLEEESRSLTIGRLVPILGKVVPSTIKVHLILDGFDEFPEVERQILVEQLKELQSWIQLRICVSWRLEARSRARKDFDVFVQHTVLEIPRANPEIEKFVSAELDTLLENGGLLITDSAVVDEIRQRLVEGADGMFLWVTLQLQAICLEDENTIHEALDNLPRSLPEIFHHVLKRGEQSGKRYQMHILKTLVAAFRPLTTAEFAEALRLALDSATRPPRLQSRQIGDVRTILSSCGSLVIIDEQDFTVHLVHRSVRQFILGEIIDTQDYREWQFTADTAHLHMAEVSMRYLSTWSDRLDVVKTASGVSPSTTPQSPPVFLPNPAAIQRAARAELKQGKLSKLLKLASQVRINNTAAPIDVRATAELLWPAMFTRASAERPNHAPGLPAMNLLGYARAFWMLHSAPMTEKDGPLYLLWSQMFTTWDTTDWLQWDVFHVANDHIDIPETVMWAVVHSHNTLLDTVLRKQKRRLRIMSICLKAILEISPLPCLSPLMAARLLTLHLFLRRGSASTTHSILNMHPDFSFNNYACLYAAVFARDYHTTRAILCAMGDPVILNSLPYPLLELSISRMDVHMTHLLLYHGLTPQHSPHVQESALALAMSRLRPGCDPSSTLIASWLLKTWVSTESCFPHHLAGALMTFKEVANERDFEPEQFIQVPIRGWLVYYGLLAAGKLMPWLRGLFTLKTLIVYAGWITFMDVSDECKVLLVFAPVSGMLFSSVVCSRFLARAKKAKNTPRAFPPVVARAAEDRATRRPWELRGTTDGIWKEIKQL